MCLQVVVFCFRWAPLRALHGALVELRPYVLVLLPPRLTLLCCRQTHASAPQPPTAMYNASILEDANVLTNLAAFNSALSSCRVAVDAIVVLKVPPTWRPLPSPLPMLGCLRVAVLLESPEAQLLLSPAYTHPCPGAPPPHPLFSLQSLFRRKGMFRTSDAFNGFLLTSLVVILVQRRVVVPAMSLHQAVRAVVQFLASTDLRSSAGFSARVQGEDGADSSTPLATMDE
jgi:hypothetical protein